MLTTKTKAVTQLNNTLLSDYDLIKNSLLKPVSEGETWILLCHSADPGLTATQTPTGSV